MDTRRVKECIILEYDNSHDLMMNIEAALDDGCFMYGNHQVSGGLYSMIMVKYED
jgi:hypothetical protein